MLFSVVIPSYNREAYIGATLRSVFAQTCEDYEVIVVDDASTDGTTGVVRGFGERVRLFEQPNSGPGAARNLGIEQARGEYVVFLDSDDLWFPWTLETLRHLIEVHGRPAIISGRPVMFSDEAELSRVSCGRADCEVYADYFACDPGLVLPGAGSMAAKTEALRAVGGFIRERVYCEDADLYMRMGEAKGVVTVKSPLTLAYRRHAGTAMMNFDLMVAGMRRMVRQERAGVYPGGAARAAERHRILAHQCRCTALNCLDAGHLRHAMDIYTDSISWNIAARRWAFIVGLPGLVLATALGLRKPPAVMHGVENRERQTADVASGRASGVPATSMSGGGGGA
ncbi:MAG: glycosyltransferase family 2 protein [Phycisphaerales bacterium]